jgi:hypothetical protein
MAFDHHEVDWTQVFNARGVQEDHDATVADVHTVDVLLLFSFVQGAHPYSVLRMEPSRSVAFA